MRLRLKRILDVSLCILFSPFLFPVFFVLCVFIFLFIGRPLFFKQIRPGLDERLFKLIKFRTMKNLRDQKGNLLPDSQRLTYFGKILRSTSLDELPEIWNVLKGDMSLVGPRPLLIEYLPLYNLSQKKRHQMRPGITGLAQISGRNNIDWNNVFLLDYCYVRRWSLCLDFLILVKTVWKVLKRENISQQNQVTREPFKGIEK